MSRLTSALSPVTYVWALDTSPSARYAGSRLPVREIGIDQGCPPRVGLTAGSRWKPSETERDWPATGTHLAGTRRGEAQPYPVLITLNSTTAALPTLPALSVALIEIVCFFPLPPFDFALTE